MPMKEVSFRRWEIVTAFLFNVAAIVVVAILLNNAIDTNQKQARQNKQNIAAIAKLAEDGKQAHDSICTLKGDFKRRVRESNTFLKKHPNGIDGISATDIQRSISGTRRTIKALSKVQCTEES